MINYFGCSFELMVLFIKNIPWKTQLNLNLTWSETLVWKINTTCRNCTRCELYIFLILLKCLFSIFFSLPKRTFRLKIEKSYFILCVLVLAYSARRGSEYASLYSLLQSNKNEACRNIKRYEGVGNNEISSFILVKCKMHWLETIDKE